MARDCPACSGTGYILTLEARFVKTA